VARTRQALILLAPEMAVTQSEATQGDVLEERREERREER